MFPINKYKYDNLSPIITGGKKSDRVLGAVKKSAVYLAFAVLLIFELLEPLTTEDAYKRLDSNRGLMGTFPTFMLVTPVIIITQIYYFNQNPPELKKKNFLFAMVISMVFILVQFSLTIAALVVGEAYLDENDTERRAKKRGFLYTKVILLFIGMVIALTVGFSAE
jgi:hypothetical protein